MNDQILNQNKFNELRNLLKGKELNYESIGTTLKEMGFKKAPDIRISTLIKKDNEIWAELRYNNMSIRVSLDTNNIVL